MPSKLLLKGIIEVKNGRYFVYKNDLPVIPNGKILEIVYEIADVTVSRAVAQVFLDAMSPYQGLSDMHRITKGAFQRMVIPALENLKTAPELLRRDIEAIEEILMQRDSGFSHYRAEVRVDWGMPDFSVLPEPAEIDSPIDAGTVEVTGTAQTTMDSDDSTTRRIGETIQEYYERVLGRPLEPPTPRNLPDNIQAGAGWRIV